MLLSSLIVLSFPIFYFFCTELKINWFKYVNLHKKNLCYSDNTVPQYTVL